MASTFNDDDDDAKGGFWAWLSGSTLWALVSAALLITVLTLATIYSGIFTDDSDAEPVVSGDALEPAGAEEAPAEGDGTAGDDAVPGTDDTESDADADADADGDGDGSDGDDAGDTDGDDADDEGGAEGEAAEVSEEASALASDINELFQAEPILFATGSAQIDASSQATLDRAAELLNELPEVEMLITGHTDSQGEDASNLQLSQDRAQAVLDYLVTAGGVAENRLSAEGRGETELIVDGDGNEDPAASRRIEVEATRG